MTNIWGEGEGARSVRGSVNLTRDPAKEVCVAECTRRGGSGAGRRSNLLLTLRYIVQPS